MKRKLCSICLAAAVTLSGLPATALAQSGYDPVSLQGQESAVISESGEESAGDEMTAGDLPDAQGTEGENSGGEMTDAGENGSDASGTGAGQEVSPEETENSGETESPVSEVPQEGQKEDVDAGGAAEENPSTDSAGETIPEEAVVTGILEEDNTLSSGEEAASEEITVFGISDLNTDENGVLRSVDAESWDTILQNTVSWLRGSQSQILNSSFLSGVSSTNTDWTVFSLARLGIEENYSGFLASAEAYVADMYAADPQYGLSYNKATEWHRLSLAVLAAGGDPASVAGRNLIADGVYNCLIGDPWTQGVNGAFWGLLALDSMGYQVPEGASYSRETLIQYILDQQTASGGWSLFGGSPDVDMTAMGIYSLAPYYAGDEQVRSAIDRGLSFLRSSVSADGDLSSDGDYNCESTAQAIVAFASMGIDPSTVTSQVSGKSLLDGLAKYYNTNTGGFRHTMADTESNAMATDQALYAIAACRYYQNGLSVWDFRASARTSLYEAQAGDSIYTAQAGSAAVLQVGSGTKELELKNIPIGNYDAAEIRVGDRVYEASAARNADGRRPVSETIPVEDGTVLEITVYRQTGAVENWTLTIQMDEGAAVSALIDQIDRLPRVQDLTLEDRSALEAAQKTFDALTGEQQSQVTNRDKLTELTARMEELVKADEEEKAQKRQELQEKIQQLPDPIKISDRNTVNQYLRELESLGEWDGREVLQARLETLLAEIQKRQDLVDSLDQDIWDQIDPLRVSQEDAKTVNSLMTRYAVLRLEEQEMLENGQNLLDAADIIQSLENGILPAKIFQNIRSTGESFTYSGTLPDGDSYTLTYEGKEIQAASADVDAGVRLREGSNLPEGAVLQVEFDQAGSMNGTVALQAGCGVEDGTYQLYWFHPDKLEIQSAGTARVENGQLFMNVSVGGRYWLSRETVLLDGNDAWGNVQGLRTETGGNEEESESGALAAGTSRSSRTSGTTVRRNTSASGNTSSKNILTTEKEGLMSGEELKSIQGTSRNLQGKGTIDDATAYTFTINGGDVEKTADFSLEIHSGEDCKNAEDILALGVDPLILCMEDAEEFPGKLLITLETELEDGTTLLFRYDPANREAQYVRKLNVEDGTAAFTLEKGGDYFIAKRALAGSLNDSDTTGEQKLIRAESGQETAEVPEETAGTESAKADNSISWAVPAGIGGVVAAAAVAAGVILYRRRKQGE
ncbi:MAG: hypothetical protein KH275_14465 [Clostridiales bacterium]|nr:hypothetical protein [Clostridiales bacterium]